MSVTASSSPPIVPALGIAGSLRIVHLLAPAPFGGLEQVVHALAAGQKRDGHDVRVIALLETGVAEPSLIPRLRAAGIPVIPVTCPARSFRSQRRSVLEICREITPDIVHSHGYLPDVLSASLASSFRAARVTTVHGFTGGRWRNRLYEWMQRRSYARFDAVVAVSKRLAGELGSSRSARRKVSPLPNAWESGEQSLPKDSARALLGLSAAAFNIGWVGRISREKGLDVLVEALASLGDLPVKVIVIGEGVERARLESRARDLRVDDRISWRGELADASRLMPAFDLLVNSSRTEGTPITIFEAMHAGVPIVATSVGGVPDVLSTDDAILVPSENPGALASAIRLAHDARAQAANRADHARDRLRREYALGPWVESYEKIYREALSARTTE